MFIALVALAPHTAHAWLLSSFLVSPNSREKKKSAFAGRCEHSSTGNAAHSVDESDDCAVKQGYHFSDLL